jgi:hypothetical protein
MDSIPQELIDAIIGNVPQSSLPSCSLVAKRWRRTSQQRLLSTILFSSEDRVNRWCTDIPRDGIPSYVRCLKIEDICYWDGPALLSRTLETLSSLTTLSMNDAKIPDELPGHISRGEFGKGITALYLHDTYCTLATVTSMILSLPDLKKLSIQDCHFMSGEPLPTDLVTPQRRPLESLELHGFVGGIAVALAESRFISSRLFSDVDISGMEQLLMLSSETVVELKLCGMWFLWILIPTRDNSDRSSR